MIPRLAYQPLYVCILPTHPSLTIFILQMDLFGINQFQEVRCEVCQTVSRRTEPLLGVVLSLPEKEPRQKIDEIQLMDCFKSLQSTGRFVGNNQFDCDICREKTDAEWRVTLQRRPQSLLISLRRTLWDKVKGLHKDSRINRQQSRAGWGWLRRPLRWYWTMPNEFCRGDDMVRYIHSRK